MSSTSQATSPLEALKAGFRRACVRRLVGDEQGAIQILRDEIPSLVVGWAKTSSLDAAEKKSKLKELFDDESSRADELSTAFDLFSSRFEARVVELVRKEVGTLSQSMLDAVRQLQGVVSSAEQLADALRSIDPSGRGESGNVEDRPTLETSLIEEKIAQPEQVESLPQEEAMVPRVVPESEEVGTDLAEEFPQEDIQSHSSPETGADEPEEIGQNLDPPTGIGLRFDEIEEMIDEILFKEPPAV